MTFFSIASEMSSLELLAVNILLQVTAISCLAILAARFARHASVTRWWLLGLALLLILLSPATAWLAQSFHTGILAKKPSTPIDGSASFPASDTEPAVAAIPPIGEVPIGRYGEPFDSSRSSALPPNSPKPSEVMHTADEATPSLGHADNPRWALWRLWRNAFLIGLTVWALITIYKITRIGIGWRQVQAIRQKSMAIESGITYATFIDVCRSLNCPVPQLLSSGHVHGPVATGILQPAVILPESLLECPENDLEDILVHEVAHVARRDQVIVILQHVVASLFWAHPLVHKLNREFAQAREEVCDNFVLCRTPAASYGRTLLRLAQRVEEPMLPVSVGMLDGWSLESRVAGLLRPDRNKDTTIKRSGLLTVAVLFVVALALGFRTTVSVVANEDPVATAQDRKNANARPDGKMTAQPTGKAANATRIGKPLPPSTRFHFSGVVLGANKEPVASAKVYVAKVNAKPLATTDENGRFEFTREKRQLPKNAAWGLNKLVAMKDGFGIGFSPILRFETTGRGKEDLRLRNPGKKFSSKSPPAVLQLAKDDVPVRGRIVDLEGRPLADVSVQVRLVGKI